MTSTKQRYELWQAADLALYKLVQKHNEDPRTLPARFPGLYTQESWSEYATVANVTVHIDPNATDEQLRAIADPLFELMSAVMSAANVHEDVWPIVRTAMHRAAAQREALALTRSEGAS